MQLAFLGVGAVAAAQLAGDALPLRSRSAPARKAGIMAVPPSIDLCCKYGCLFLKKEKVLTTYMNRRGSGQNNPERVATLSHFCAKSLKSFRKWFEILTL
ncbi:hypothetical protein A3841_18075 [Pontibacter flavimaris]|uniref:Uncharacterized protein n=1 Tax=Pontibacter flavimaris TaxID=1797110 RepID=A0A1Q5PDC7_9BACT|nr:hypothetical protein A3841_18075 [Pontibacter flavimaris]